MWFRREILQQMNLLFFFVAMAIYEEYHFKNILYYLKTHSVVG